jgi:hypothetical protein
LCPGEKLRGFFYPLIFFAKNLERFFNSQHLYQNAIMKNFCTFPILLLLGITLSAQPNKKIAPALSTFLNTEFMLKFNDLKIDGESTAADIIARETQLFARRTTRLPSAPIRCWR